ncbi:MAG: SagB/ThcOx family dehydrogenase [Deltaproteobacteria bacterium]|nr:SagB/ThcOx family dehydrogenase [Deltaproteobacteria bacterium]
MKKTTTTTILVLFASLAMLFQPCTGLRLARAQEANPKAAIDLPPPVFDGPMSLEKALLERRSVRAYKDEPLTLADISQILWAAQGITETKQGLRTAPSARALYPLNLYLLVGKVDGVPVGLYRYQPQGHKILKVHESDKKAELHAAVGQAPIRGAAAVIVVTGMTRTSKAKWIYLERGHAAQNILLQAHSRKIGAVVMGGFRDEDVRKVLNVPESEQPVYIIPMGRMQDEKMP